MPAVYALAFLCAVIGTIYVSLKAKPLGGLRYRWATFIGVSGLVFSVPGFYQDYWLYPDIHLLNLAFYCCSVASNVEILRRRRLGVVMLPVGLLLAILRYPYIRTVTWYRPYNFAGFVLLVATIGTVNIAYFKKRWHLLGAKI